MFITLEGIDGSGKSTAAVNLVRMLKDRGLDVIHTREPGGSVGAEAIRNTLLHTEAADFCPDTQMLLVFAARFNHLQKLIRPALEAGRVVVCERFIDTTFAYQVAGQGADPKLFFDLCSQIDLEPDITFLLDVKPQIGIERVLSRGGNKADVIEEKIKSSTITCERIAEGFKQRLEESPDRIWSINANLSLDHVNDELAACTEEIDGTITLRQKQSRAPWWQRLFGTV